MWIRDGRCRFIRWPSLLRLVYLCVLQAVTFNLFPIILVSSLIFSLTVHSRLNLTPVSPVDSFTMNQFSTSIYFSALCWRSGPEEGDRSTCGDYHHSRGRVSCGVRKGHSKDFSKTILAVVSILSGKRTLMVGRPVRHKPRVRTPVVRIMSYSEGKE